MESNPGTFGVSAERIPPPARDDEIRITLTLGDARRLHSLLSKGFPSNEYNSVWSLRNRLLDALQVVNVNCKDLG